MYEQYFGLRERPFDLSPNPKFLYLSSGHREALAHLRYGLTGRPGLTVILGEAGTGKTTLVRAALNRSDESAVVCLSNPTLTRSEFYEYLAAGFGLGEQAAISKSCFLRELEAAVTRRSVEGGVLALIVDEAQSLPDGLLEEIRLLTNIETPSGASLAVALVGQPELASRLNDARLRQLKQRVALRCTLTPLNLQDTASYVAVRVRVAGGKPETLFSREAVIAVHQQSSGIPRMISVICDNALVTGFAMDRKPIDREVILEVCRDFEIGEADKRSDSGAADAPTSDQKPPDLSEATPSATDKAQSAPAATRITFLKVRGI